MVPVEVMAKSVPEVPTIMDCKPPVNPFKEVIPDEVTNPCPRTKAVVAICPVEVPAPAVGARGVPTSVGEEERTTVVPEPVVACSIPEVTLLAPIVRAPPSAMVTSPEVLIHLAVPALSYWSSWADDPDEGIWTKPLAVEWVMVVPVATSPVEKVRAACLLLKVVQLAADRSPLFDPEAVGILKV